MLNVGAQAIGFDSKWIARLDGIQFVERLAQSTGSTKRSGTIESTLAVADDRERLARRRIARANFHG
jgi:hypothetical protein